MSNLDREEYNTNNPFFPVNDQLDQETLVWDPEKRRNWWYEPTKEEILKECEYLLSLSGK